MAELVLGARLKAREMAITGIGASFSAFCCPETRARVATSIRLALQPYQRGKQVALAGAIWLVTANNA